MWKNILFSNIEASELYDISLNISDTNIDYNKSNINDNATILVVTYLIKLDPRIQQNTQVIYKLINMINNTLHDKNINIYQNLTKSIGNGLQKVTSFVLPTSQLSCIYWIKLSLFLF